MSDEIDFVFGLGFLFPRSGVARVVYHTRFVGA